MTKIGSKRFYQYLATAACSVMTLTCGLHYGWSSPSLVKLEDAASEVHLTSDQGSWLTVSLVVGIIIGAVLSGVILNKIGRRTAALITTIPFLISWCLLAFGQSFPVLIAGRLIAGVPDSMVYCMMPVYLGEVADSDIRGLMISFTSISLGFGFLFMNITGTFLSIRAAALIASSFSILAFLLFLLLPESPYYLIAKGCVAEAKQSLRVFKASADVDAEFNRISKAVEDDLNSSAGRYWDLFTVPSNRKALWILFGVSTVQQMSGYMAINFYAQSIFTNVQSDVPVIVWSSIYLLLQMVFTGVNSFLVDRAGRKLLMIVSSLGNLVTLATLSVVFYLNSINKINEDVFTVTSIVALIAFVVIFSIGLPSATFLIVGEMFPTNVRSYAASFHEFYICALTIFVTKLYYLTKDNFGIHVPFLIFAIFSILGLSFIIFFVPETKGKTLEEIQIMLKGEDEAKTNVELQLIK